MSSAEPTEAVQAKNTPARNQIGLFSSMAIGIGGMVGAGIFSILGVVGEAAGTAMWVSFSIGGAVALMSAYSYAKLGARYPSAGGAVEFPVKGFGDGVITGGINLYMWIGYVIALALYAQAFAGYFMTFFHPYSSTWLAKTIGISIVLIFTAINFIGAKIVGQSESLIVAVKLCILLLFAAAGLIFAKPEYLAPSLWPATSGILFGAGVLFIGYEGFGLVTNAAENMANPRVLLPKALYLSVISVIIIYLAVSVAVIGNLRIQEVVAAKDYALAAAAKPFLGQFGFRLIAIGALFSTASAINATLFGAANVSYMIARDGELPKIFSRSIWQRSMGGLLITSAVVIMFILCFDLSGVAMMGSGAFLLIYACVHSAHMKITSETRAKRWMVFLALLACLAMFVILSIYMYHNSKPAVITMVALIPICLIAEWTYRGITGRAIRTRT